MLLRKQIDLHNDSGNSINMGYGIVARCVKSLRKYC